MSRMVATVQSEDAGSVQEITEFLHDIRLNHMQSSSLAFVKATRMSNLKWATELITDPDTDPMAYNKLAFKEACIAGKHHIVELLLIRLHPEYSAHEELISASFRGHLDVVRVLLTRPHLETLLRGGSKAVDQACAGGHLETLQLLLKESRIDPTVTYTPITTACTHGHIDVLRLLLEDGRFDPGAPCGCNVALRAAVQAKHVDAVKLMLQDSRVDPGGDANQALITASTVSDEITCLLLRDIRVNPLARSDSDIFKSCCRYGFADAVAMLLKDVCIDPNAKTGKGLEVACIHNHYAVVKLLLEDKRMHPLQMIACACAHDSWEIVPLLLKDQRADPNSRWESIHQSENSALVLAAVKGNLETVVALLQDNRTNPGMNANLALQVSRDKILHKLLQDGRVDPSANNNAAIKSTSKNVYDLPSGRRGRNEGPKTYRLTEVYMLLKDKRVFGLDCGAYVNLNNTRSGIGWVHFHSVQTMLMCLHKECLDLRVADVLRDVAFEWVTMSF